MTQSVYRKPAIGDEGKGSSTSFAALVSQKGQTREDWTSYPSTTLLVPRGSGSPSTYPQVLGAPSVSGCAGTWRSII